nr:hypothetical protein TetV2_00298 [Oceanusvirus sp.]
MAGEATLEMLSRMTRGSVPEWGDDYIDRFVPENLLEEMRSRGKSWRDSEGFDWGFPYVRAIRLADGRPAVVVASRADGEGNSTSRAVLADGSELTVAEPHM